MKKRNKNVLKRALASIVALTMCTSMLSTAAFAAEAEDEATKPDDRKDYVYVFISVSSDPVTPNEDDLPTFNVEKPDNTL